MPPRPTRAAAPRAPRPPLALLAALALAACDATPLRWEPVSIADTTAADTAAAGATPVPATLPADARGARCDASVRVARLGDAGLVAVWWAVRPDSTAVLLAARGASGGATWEPALPVDTLDRGAHGCARPAPAVAFEPRTQYVHVSYALDAPEGTGIFFAHSMDAGRMYHSPVSIVYGPRLARTDVAARGDTVALAYEDPNSAEPQVALALSVTAGHIFEEKSLVVSSGAFAATAPAVAIDAGGVTVRWRERQQGREVPMRRRAAWAR